MTKNEMQAEMDRLKAIIGIKEAAASRNAKRIAELEAERKEYRQENRMLRYEIDWLRKQI